MKTVADTPASGAAVLVAPDDTTAVLPAGEPALALPAVAQGLLPVLEILPVQLLMVPMALARGLEPRNFLNGSKITIIE